MKFFHVYLEEGRRKKFAEACLLSSTTIEDIDCPVCKTKWVKGTFDRPLEIILTKEYLPDYTYIFPERFVSQKLKEVILNHNLADINFERVITKTLIQLNEDQIKEFKLDGMKVNKFCTIPSTYFAIEISTGISIHSDMGVIPHKCENCGRHSFTKLIKDNSMLVDFILDLSTWNGQDFFTVEGFPQCFICTDRFIEICQNENITGMLFKEVEVKKLFN